mmetsp:Transcript_6107/g.18762  ORF Transcript_6107/g.18762 Transcript_6107/m.18762 type:complete len:316 (-) Transcript_6107:549-1496(-)
MQHDPWSAEVNIEASGVGLPKEWVAACCRNSSGQACACALRASHRLPRNLLGKGGGRGLLLLDHFEQTLPAVTDGVLGAARNTLCDAVPLVSNFAHGGDDDGVLGLRPAYTLRLGSALLAGGSRRRCAPARWRRIDAALAGHAGGSLGRRAAPNGAKAAGQWQWRVVVGAQARPAVAHRIVRATLKLGGNPPPSVAKLLDSVADCLVLLGGPLAALERVARARASTGRPAGLGRELVEYRRLALGGDHRGQRHAACHRAEDCCRGQGRHVSHVLTGRTFGVVTRARLVREGYGQRGLRIGVKRGREAGRGAARVG